MDRHVPWAVAATAGATALAAGVAGLRARRQVRATLAEQASERAAAEVARERRARENLRYRLLVEHTCDVATILDANNCLSWCSASCRQVLGYSAEELVARGAAEGHPDDLPVARACIAEAREGESRRYTMRLRHADGGWRWLECDASLLPDVDGLGPAVAVVGRDITERVAAEEGRRATEGRLRDLVERAAFGIYTCDADWRFENVNPALVAMLGYRERNELLGLDVSRDLYVHMEERDRLQQQLLAGTLPDWVEVAWRRADGSPITVRLSARTSRDAHGAVVACEGIVENVTERGRREAMLRRSERLASLGRMLAGAAHELNNPLAAVCGFAQLLLRGPVSEDQRVALEIIDREAARAAVIVRDLLTFSRRREGERFQPVDVNAIVRYVIGTRRYALRAGGTTLELALADEPLQAMGDATQLEQVLLNLVTNAEQATEQRLAGDDGDGERARVIVRTERRDGAIVVQVEDNGPGIAADHLASIWDPFWSTRSEGEGTGLGLAVVHEIVTAHGGEIDVQSTPGAGARFRVTLPMADGAAAERPHRGGAARPLDILIVGNDADACFLARFLGARGHAVVTADNGAQALQLTGRDAFHVALIDLPLDTGDGADLIDALRTLPRERQPRLLVCVPAQSVPADAEPAAGVDALVRKPYDVEALRQAVEGE